MGVVGIALGVPIGCGAVLTIVAGGPIALHTMRHRRARAVTAAVPDTLERVAAELRAGGTVASAIAWLGVDGGPLTGDFARVQSRVELGAPIPAALASWAAERVAAGASSAAGALAVAHDVGGRAAEALDSLAASLRDRLAVVAEAHALSAQARYSALVVGLGPLVYLAFSIVMDRRAADALFGTAAGRMCALAGIALELVGRVVDAAHPRLRSADVILAVALGWGIVVAGAVLGLFRRIEIIRRTRAMARRAPRTMPRVLAGLIAHPACRTVRRVVAAPFRRRRMRRHDDAVLTELPIAVDLVGVAVGAGCSTFQAVAVAARWSPPRLADVLGEVGRATAIGASFDAALVAAGANAPNVRRLTETLRTSTRLGSPATASLARLAQEVRADVRRRAEARARTVPVRLLFPLVFCVLPAFALLTVVPVLLDGIAF